MRHRPGFPSAVIAFLTGLLCGPSVLALTPLAANYGQCEGTTFTQTIVTGPAADYQAAVNALQPGQRLMLQSGTTATVCASMI